MGDNPHSHANESKQAEKRAEAYRLRLRGLSLRAVAAELGVSHQTVSNWTRTEADALVLPLADELRKQQHERLEELRQAALAVLERQHVLVSHGRVIREGEPEIDEETGEAVIRAGAGEPLPDDGPALQAIDRLLKVEERLSRLHGLDAPAQQEITATVESRPAELLALLDRTRAGVEAQEAELTGGET